MITAHRRRVKSLGLILSLVLVAAACGGDDASTAGSSSTSGDGGGAPTGDPIVVGGLFNLSGPASVTGITEFQGVELAVEMINEGGGIEGRPLELDAKDVESSPDIAVTTARDMVRSGREVVIGPTLASLCEGVRSITEPAGVLTYCLSPIPPMSDLVFNIEYSPAAVLGFGPAPYMVERGWTRVACLHAADVSGQAYLSTLEGAAASFGFDIVATESFQPGDLDVTAQLTSIRGTDPDVIFSCASGGDHVTVLRGMEQLGMDHPVILGFGGTSFEVAELAADYLSPGGVFSLGSPAMVADQLPEDFEGRQEAQDFAAAYEAKYGEKPSHLAGLAFDATFAVAAALGQVSEGGAEIAAALEGVCDLQGAMTQYCFGPEDHSGYQLRQPMIVRWTDEGTFELDSFIDPEGIPGRQPPG